MSIVWVGVDFFPLPINWWLLVLHAGCFYYWGKNGNPDNFMQSKTLYVTTGLTFDMNLLNIRRK